MFQYRPPELPLTEIPTARTAASQSNVPVQTSSYRPPSAVSQRSSTSQNGTSPKEARGSFTKPGGRRKKQGGASNTMRDGEASVHLNQMGQLYEKILKYGTGTRYSIYILPVALILMVPVIVGATQVSSSDPKIGGVRLVWFFTWFLSVWLSLWGSIFVVRIIPQIFAYFAGVVSSETKKYARVLENLQSTITVLLWVIVSFVLYEVLFSTASAGNTPYAWTQQFREVMAAILVSTIIFMVEKTFVQFVSVNYHARSFNYRTDESKRAVDLLSILFDASRALFPMYEDNFLEENYLIHANIETFIRKGRKGHRILSNRASHSTGRRIFKGIGRFSNKVNSVFGNIAAELAGKSVLPPRSAQRMVVEALEKTKSSKALAQRVWLSFVMEGNDVLHLSDIQEVLGPNSHDIAEECFDLLDPDRNGDVTLDEIALKVTELCIERKAIGRSMHDVSQAIKALDNTLGAVAFLFSVFALICFLDTGFRSILSTASTTLLSLSFVFSATAQEFLGSCIFLFVKHPYDIGDRVHISGPDGVNQLKVEQISLLYTGFKRITDLELIQIPNSVLNTLWINNVSRSRGLMERIDVFISFDTTMEDIETLRSELEAFITHEDNKREFHPDLILRCLGVGNMDKLQLQLEVRHKSNWSVESIRAARHSKLMCALVLAMRKVPILGPGGGGAPLGDPSNPSYSVAISDAQATRSREKAAKDADAGRLYPLHVPVNKNASAVEGRSSSEKDSKNGDREHEPLASIPEIMAADGLNSIRLSDGYLKDQEHENDNFRIIGDQQNETTPSANQSERGTASSLALKKTRSAQGRRKPGLTAPSRTSNASVGGNHPVLQRVPTHTSQPSHANEYNFDQEAQT